jgi:hypothetical protein
MSLFSHFGLSKILVQDSVVAGRSICLVASSLSVLCMHDISLCDKEFDPVSVITVPRNVVINVMLNWPEFIPESFYI